MATTILPEKNQRISQILLHRTESIEDSNRKEEVNQIDDELINELTR